MKANWLDQLAPAHAPAPPGWWPPAPGWWAVMVLGLLAVAVVMWAWRRGPMRRQRRAALRELERIAQGACDCSQVARSIQALLRRYALSRFGHDAVASLSGQPWLDWVIAHGGDEFAGESGRSLLRRAYGGDGPCHRTGWLTAARAFVRRTGARGGGGARQ